MKTLHFFFAGAIVLAASACSVANTEAPVDTSQDDLSVGRSLVGLRFESAPNRFVAFTSADTAQVAEGGPTLDAGYTVHGRRVTVQFGFTPAVRHFRLGPNGQTLRADTGEVFHLTATDGGPAPTCHSVAGFDFEGPKVLDALPPGSACPPFISPEEDACHAASGHAILADGCHPLCDVPIARPTEVAGFSFAAFEVRPAAPPGLICAAFVSAEAEACAAVGGELSGDAHCGVLCSKPIAAAGQVAGFTFEGLAIRTAPAEGLACPEIASEALIACTAAGGKTTKDANCNDLCTTPIAHQCLL